MESVGIVRLASLGVGLESFCICNLGVCLGLSLGLSHHLGVGMLRGVVGVGVGHGLGLSLWSWPLVPILVLYFFRLHCVLALGQISPLADMDLDDEDGVSSS